MSTNEGPFPTRTYEDQAINPENLTPMQWREGAFVVKGSDLLYARTILFKVLQEADRRSFGMEVKDPLSPNEIKCALESLGGRL